MNSDRIKEIQMTTAYPESVSVKQALLQVWNECEQEQLRRGVVSGSLQPLTVNRVSEIMQQLSKETWIALQGDEHGWTEWWNGRNKLNVNSNNR